VLNDAVPSDYAVNDDLPLDFALCGSDGENIQPASHVARQSADHNPPFARYDAPSDF